MRRICLGLLLCLVVALARAETSLQDRQARAREERSALRTQIKELQERIASSESTRDDASAALQASEEAISDISRRLADLDARHAQLEDSLSGLETARHEQTGELERQQQALAAQLRAQYASGLSPWSALLSGRDPQQIGRELAYLAYITRARTQALEGLGATLDRLGALRRQTDDSRKELDALVADTLTEKQALQEQQAKRREVLGQIQDRLKEERGQADALQARDARMGRLIKGLEVEIAKAEARRQAALKAEAERRARERAEQARLERQRALERKEQQARLERERQAQAEQARQAEPSQAEPSRAEPSQADQAEPTRNRQAPTEADQAEAPSRDTAPARPARAEPDGGFAGLKKGLPAPVAGAIQGRFGAQRPDGGLWRGIVLRAAAGTPVKAVAAGRVVYAHWLSGFGNLLIVDHGQQYLSIYAYNQALLRQVGDVVARGDVLARVGATGGQVEPGLYFELRHQGAPLNPQLWLRP